MKITTIFNKIPFLISIIGVSKTKGITNFTYRYVILLRILGILIFLGI